MINLLPSTAGTDLASTSSAFIDSPGIISFVILLFGVGLAFFVIESLIVSWSERQK